MTLLKKLWLHNTAVTDKGIAFLANLKSLEQLEIYDTLVSDEGVRQLQAALPQCRIVRQVE
jgi:hypothetical protein